MCGGVGAVGGVNGRGVARAGGRYVALAAFEFSELGCETYQR